MDRFPRIDHRALCDKIGPQRINHLDVVERAHLECRWQVYYAIDRRCLPVRPTNTAFIDEHLNGRTDEIVTAPSGNGIL
jgi:hypothetical protein